MDYILLNDEEEFKGIKESGKYYHVYKSYGDKIVHEFKIISPSNNVIYSYAISNNNIIIDLCNKSSSLQLCSYEDRYYMYTFEGWWTVTKIEQKISSHEDELTSFILNDDVNVTYLKNSLINYQPDYTQISALNLDYTMSLCDFSHICIYDVITYFNEIYEYFTKKQLDLKCDQKTSINFQRLTTILNSTDKHNWGYMLRSLINCQSNVMILPMVII